MTAKSLSQNAQVCTNIDNIKGNIRARLDKSPIKQYLKKALLGAEHSNDKLIDEVFDILSLTDDLSQMDSEDAALVVTLLDDNNVVKILNSKIKVVIAAMLSAKNREIGRLDPEADLDSIINGNKQLEEQGEFYDSFFRNEAGEYDVTKLLNLIKTNIDLIQ